MFYDYLDCILMLSDVGNRESKPKLKSEIWGPKCNLLKLEGLMSKLACWIVFVDCLLTENREPKTGLFF